MKLWILIIAIFLEGCCAKRPEYSIIIMPPTQQEQRIQALQEQALRKQIESTYEEEYYKNALRKKWLNK